MQKKSLTAWQISALATALERAISSGHAAARRGNELVLLLRDAKTITVGSEYPKADYWLKRVSDQRKWVEEHGGDVAGYVERYGSENDTRHYGAGGGKSFYR